MSTFRYILDQNARIANGTVKGTTINLHFLGIGNGLTVSHCSAFSCGDC